MNQNIYENPFSRCTARDMSYKEVLEYWCNPFINNNIMGLDEQELFTNPTPIIIEGARGSGKTMILKYLSYYCQKDFNQNIEDDLFTYFKNKGSLGIYLRYKEDFVNMLANLNCSDYSKNLLFAYYYELLITREILQVIEDLFNKTSGNGLYNEEKQLLINKLSSYFSKEYVSLNECTNDIIKKINDLDQWIKKARYIQSAEDDLLKMIKIDIINSIISIARNTIQALTNVLFIIIIDEYENAHEYQKILNTFIKKVDSSEKITYRIGMRVEGMSTMETDVGNEWLQINRDFLKKELVFKNNFKYKKFLFSISEKRLKHSQFFSSYNLTNIEELLDAKEDLEKEAILILENVRNREKHFDLLKEKIKDPNELKTAISQLRCPEHPLMEMLNIIWILRGKKVEDTKFQMREYIDGKAEKNSKYKNDYVNKYKYQLIFSLLKNHQMSVKKQYYSFNTFAFLSSGSVNDFISLCRNTFYQLDDTYYDNIHKDKRIPQELQTIGAKKTALEQLRNIQSNNESGTEMYTFIMNLGELFSYIHKEKGVKYPETNQFAFEDESEIHQNKELYPILIRLLKWGGIIKKPNIQSISIGQRKGNVYYLNHIFAPLFNISYRIRGGYNPVLSTELFERMIYHSMKGEDIDNQLVVKNMKKTIHPTQRFLF